MDNSEILDSPEDPALSLDTKRRGELAELAFLRKAISLGFGVAKPWGDSDRFDFILGHERLLWRVQIKSVWGQGPNYRLGISRSGGRRPYTADEIDFLAAYVNAEDLWYIFPVNFLGGRTMFCITPHFQKSPFRKFLEGWQQFREGMNGPVTE